MIISMSWKILKLIYCPIRFLANWLGWLLIFARVTPDSSLLRPIPPRSIMPISKLAPAGERRYVTSSLFLYRCYQYLTRYPVEDLHLVTGIELNGYSIMTDIVELENVDRSIVGASADVLSTGNGLLLMERFGAKCLGLFHTHPGKGCGSTHPSGTDWSNQKIWEKAFPLVSAVFSQDGFLRFFSSKPNLSVEVRGKQVEKIDENLYRLEIDQNLPLP